MATEVIMPKLGMTMSDGTVVKWLKEVGDEIPVDRVPSVLALDGERQRHLAHMGICLNPCSERSGLWERAEQILGAAVVTAKHGILLERGKV